MVKRAGKTGLQLATFAADVTPRIGYGNAKSIEHPLLAKGIMLRDRKAIYVLCALDWCYIANRSYDLFRREIAAAVGTVPSRVALQCVHQHDVVCVDDSAQDLLDKVPQPPSVLVNRVFLRGAIGQVVAAVRRAATQWQQATHVGTGWAPVDQVASTRRILQPDGAIRVRFSRGGRDPAQRVLPEGTIDAFIRTLSFYNGNTPLVNMHYYTTHPQSAYGDGRVSYDVPGIARERLEKESGVFQVYFNGCGADVSMGKYNDATPACRAVLAERLYTGMTASLAKTTLVPLPPVHWKIIPVRLPSRRDKNFSESSSRAVLNDIKASAVNRVLAASNLIFKQRVKAGSPLEISCLSMGAIRVLNMPGEPFVEYQLWAQRSYPDRFVFMAGYGDCAPFYICTDRAYADKGGYEQTWALTDPCEKILKKAVARAMD